MSSNNSFSSRSNARRNPFVHASNADDNGASEMSAQGHERNNSALLSLGESGALDIPMGGGRRHGRAGSYDASTLPVPDDEFLARSLREQESLELAASKIAEQRLSFDKPRPVLRMHKDQAMSVPPSADTTPQKQPRKVSSKRTRGTQNLSPEVFRRSFQIRYRRCFYLI